MMFLDTCVPTLRNRTNKNNNKCFLHKWFKVVQPIAIPMCEHLKNHYNCHNATVCHNLTKTIFSFSFIKCVFKKSYHGSLIC